MSLTLVTFILISLLVANKPSVTNKERLYRFFVSKSGASLKVKILSVERLKLEASSPPLRLSVN